MKLKREHIVVLLLFLSYFLTRMYFSYQTDNLTGDYSYFALRQIESIQETGKPILNDNLSYAGRTFVFMPFYIYILSLLTLFTPTVLTLKILTNLFASTVIIAVYIVSSKIIKKKHIPIICAVTAGSIPVYINETINSISPYSVLIPCAFFLVYYFLELSKDKDVVGNLLFVSIITILVTPASILLVAGIVTYHIINFIENIKPSRIELEYTIFLVFFYLWAYFIMYKNAFTTHGFSVIWENTPTLLFEDYFKNIDILNLITGIGLIPFLFGSYAAYSYILKKKSKSIIIFVSFFVVTLGLFWFRLIESGLAIIFLGSSLIILFGQALKDILSYIKHTKFSHNQNKIYAVILLILFLTQGLPGIYAFTNTNSNTYKDSFMQDFLWLKENTKSGSVIIADISEGHLLTYISERKNMVDSETLLISDINTRMEDLKTLYTTKFKIEAIRTFNKYDADYLVLSKNSKSRYNIESISYIEDECFIEIYKNEIVVYEKRKRCEIKE